MLELQNEASTIQQNAARRGPAIVNGQFDRGPQSDLTLALTKAFKEPHLEVFDEEEDIELDKLVVEELKPKEHKPDKYKRI